MNILHLQLSGGPGGIVCLCRDINSHSAQNNFFYFLFEGGSIADEIAAGGGTVQIAVGAKGHPLKAATDLVRYCKAQKIDVVVDHTGSPYTRFVHIYAARRLKNVRFLLYLHSNAASSANHTLKGRAYRVLLQCAARHSGHIVAISRSVAESYVRLFQLPEEKITVVYNGTDLRRFVSHTSMDGNTLRLIYVGRILPVKGIDLLLQAVAGSRFRTRLHLDLIGSDIHGYDAEMQRLCTKLNLNDRVTFWGNRTDVPRRLQQADVFVHPAICEEGFGIALIEAMAAGLPCLAFRKGAIPEIITPGLDGEIAEPATAEGLCTALDDLAQRIFADPQVLESYSRRAKEKAAAFSIENCVTHLEELYR